MEHVMKTRSRAIVTLVHKPDDEVVETIADGLSTADEVLSCIDRWKDKQKTDKTGMKVEPYNRIMKMPDGVFVVDFGSYSYFIYVKGDVDLMKP